jgi:hypothetical protein
VLFTGGIVGMLVMQNIIGVRSVGAGTDPLIG